MRPTFSFFVLLVSLLSFSFASEDYYKILGVSRTADEKEIRNAYRQLSKKYHPDKNPDDENAQHKFMEISNAYDVLMDSEKRQIYDIHGEEGLKNGGGSGGHGGQGGFDPFRDFFGGQFNRGPPRAQDVAAEVEITLKEFFNGKNIDMGLNLMGPCEQCNGSGSSDGVKHQCDGCQGRGRVLQTRNFGNGMIQQMETACPKCRGQGNLIKHKCKTCHGQGAHEQQKVFNVHVAPGAPRNYVEVFENSGPSQPGILPGNLKVIVKEDLKKDNLGYRRVGHNLYRSEVLSLNEALNGNWSREIEFLDAYDPLVKIERKAGVIVQNGEIEIIKGKGMPIANGVDEAGDLYIEYIVVFPVKNQQKVLSSIHDEL